MTTDAVMPQRVKLSDLEDGQTLVATLRHGLTELNRDHRVGGLTDAPLVDEGRRQAAEARQRLHGVTFDVVISSPLRRAVETAIIVTGLDEARLVIDAGSVERSFGRMEGMDPADVPERFPEVRYLRIGGVGYSLNPPGGESFEELHDRAHDMLARLLDQYGGQRVLVVGHQNFLQQLHAVVRDEGSMEALEHDILNLQLDEFVLDPSGRVLRSRSLQLCRSAADHPSF